MASNDNFAVYWEPSGAPAYPSDYKSGLNQFFEDLEHDSGGHENVESVSAQYNDAGGDNVNYDSQFGDGFHPAGAEPGMLVEGCCHVGHGVDNPRARSA